ncbi:hypothetical protein GUJ93_ZPchr0015g6791 [Zizania palustris]|uniref:Uncharacterized protein n=1 Tax=Zizania palustris TaxID=103762 RepID=A0A8J5TGG6_ZIZPA|nr:hypothetical protein GUJ93_ZPchr0015g6791 [Zizania palustris]
MEDLAASSSPATRTPIFLGRPHRRARTDPKSASAVAAETEGAGAALEGSGYGLGQIGAQRTRWRGTAFG